MCMNFFQKNPPGKKTIALFVLLVAFSFVWLWGRHVPKAVVELSGERLYVAVARTPAHMYKGLGGRESMDSIDGMIFLFAYSDRQVIVMRDMVFPIDIVWLDQGVVVDIAPSVPVEQGIPEADLRRYIPRKPANAVLELSAGWAVKHSLKIGDRLTVIGQ